VNDEYRNKIRKLRMLGLKKLKPP